MHGSCFCGSGAGSESVDSPQTQAPRQFSKEARTNSKKPTKKSMMPSTPASLPGPGGSSQQQPVAPAPDAIPHKRPNRRDLAAPTNSNTSQESLQRSPIPQSSNGNQPGLQSRKPTSGSNGPLQRPLPAVGNTGPQRPNGSEYAVPAKPQAGRPPR